MNNLENVRLKNSNLNIMDINDSSFKKYGIVYSAYNLEEINQYMNILDIPDENIYIPKNLNVEKMNIIHEIRDYIFGGMEVSAGECMGHCGALSAIEYHQGSEVSIAFTDIIMVLGKRQDLNNAEYNAEKYAEIFYVPKGTIIEIFSDTLHYSPIDVEKKGFKTIVVVLNGTNTANSLDLQVSNTNTMLIKKNKFQIVHKSRIDKIRLGVSPGLIGSLITVNPI